MKSLISALRILIIATFILIVLLFLALSHGWHTPLVNYVAQPYKISIGHTELNWFPLSLVVDDLKAGEGAQAFTLKRLHVRSGLDFLTGKPVQLFIKLEQGQMAYRQLTMNETSDRKATEYKKADWQLAGLSLSQWQQLFAPEPVNEASQNTADVVKAPLPVTVHLNSLQLSDFTLDSQQEGLPDLTINRFLFGPLFTDQPEKHASLQLDLATAGGTLNIAGAVTPMAQSPSAELNLNLNGLSPDHQWLSQVPPELQVNISSRLNISVQQLSAQSQGAAQNVRSLTAALNGDLQLKDTQWITATEDNEQYRFNELNLKQIVLNVAIADFNRIDPVTELSLGQVLLQGISVTQAGLDYQLQDFSLSQLQVYADRQKAEIEAGVVKVADGVMDFKLAKQQAVTGTSGNTKEKSPDITSESSSDDTERSEQPVQPYEVRFNGESIQVIDQQITYQDLNLSDAPLTHLELASLQLDQPAYPASAPFPWAAEIWLNGQSHWLMNGDITTEPVLVNLNIRQTGLHLPDISAYSEHYADIFFAEGVMANQINFAITPQSLKGKLGFDFKNLDMSLKGRQSNLNLPLQTAFSLLKDSDDRIELSLDLDKKGKDLNVGTNAIVRELLLAASQKAAVAYLKYALQPFGSLMTLKDVGASLLKSGSIPLEPVVLEPLQQALTAGQKSYVQKVGQILQEKTDLRLNYCYYSSAQEREALMAQLGDAAKADVAVKTLNQNRLTQWRKLFASQGLADRMSQCSAKQKKEQVFPKSRFTVLLKP